MSTDISENNILENQIAANDIPETSSPATESGKSSHERPLGARLGEGFFCIIYLIYIAVLIYIMNGKYMAANAAEDMINVYRFGMGVLMASLLVGGDAFHLIPRIIIDFRGSLPKQELLLGLGSLISSITMTIFYNILITMGDSIEYSESMYNLFTEQAILVLTFIRIIILILPQNRWFSREPNRKWAIRRNVPFIIIGILTVAGLINVIHHATHYPAGFYITIMVTVILSFIFYIPVAIWGKEKPKIGMLMIPKTICYMVMLSVITFYTVIM